LYLSRGVAELPKSDIFITNHMQMRIRVMLVQTFHQL
jgi:hypothetical protein